MCCWYRRFTLVSSLLVLLTTTSVAEDFLYVVGWSEESRTSTIYWLPASTPRQKPIPIEKAAKSLLYAYRDEIWLGPVNYTLAGWRKFWLPSVIGIEAPVRGIARQDQTLFLADATSIRSSDSESGELNTILSDLNALTSLVLYEDRFYFCQESGLYSVRINGMGLQQEANGRACHTINLRGEWLFAAAEAAVWKLNVKSGEVLEVDPFAKPPWHAIETKEASYWVADNIVWKRLHDSNSDIVMMQIGDASPGDNLLTRVAAISATPYPLSLDAHGQPVISGAPGNVYQVLYSDDLQDWSLSYVERTANQPIKWLVPQSASNSAPLVWPASPVGSQAFFQAWQYDLGVAFDEDSDGLPDYWERRHFGDLTQTPEGDSNGDGITPGGISNAHRPKHRRCRW